MSYENPRQSARVLSGGQVKVLYARGIALSLCATALLLMGCVPSQVAVSEGTSGEGVEAEVDGSGQVRSESSELKDAADASSDLLGLAQVLPVTAQVELGGETIDLEVTRTPEEQATGLMYRSSLADDRGMLFSFSPAQPVRFWMKNVVIDLDMVFIHEGKIVGIAADVPPCDSTPCGTYGPGFGVLVDEVIELRGGRAAELGLAVGDAVAVKSLETETP